MCGLGTKKKGEGMGVADEDRRSGGGGSSSSSGMTQNFSLQLDKCPTDLLQRFMSNGERSDYVTPDEETQELELSLGLSLGGRFGVDKSPKSKLIRSSSIAGFVPLAGPGGEGSPTPPGGSYQPLFRTSSLPTETEEEWRKRKELQTLRRMAAKKRRSDKQRSLCIEAEKEGAVGGGEESERACNVVAPPFSLSSWAQTVFGSGGSDGIEAKGKGGVLAGGGGSGIIGIGQQTSQGSAESQGGSSSGMSESDSRLKQGSGSCSGARSPANYQHLHNRISNESAGSSSTKKDDSSSRAPRQETQGPSKKAEPSKKQGKEIGVNAMQDMPCVFTKGDGPNGRRVEGILYKYGKGEDVRIMCVCHGTFLSPAEFVKHAGGGEVDHPLRHIVINPNPTFMR